MSSDVNGILREYSEKEGLYRRFCDALFHLLDVLLKSDAVRLHVLTRRVKDGRSLEQKIRRPDKEYQHLSDVTDVVGLRIITHFAAEVHRIVALLDREFEVDRAASEDKRRTLDPNTFGYLSVHYVISLRPARATLPEYRDYLGLKAEIQVRSILQHAWAENEHDLGYKSNVAVPEAIRRRWARLAGLLELGDAELDAIRTQSVEHATKIEAAMNVIPAGGYQDIPLDRLSLAAFAAKDPILLSLEQDMATAVGAQLCDDSTVIEEAVPRLADLGISTVGALRTKLERHRTEILAMTKLRMSGFPSLSRGTEFLFLAYLLVGASGSAEALVSFFEDYNVTSPERRLGLAEAVLEQVREIRKEHPP